MILREPCWEQSTSIPTLGKDEIHICRTNWSALEQEIEKRSGPKLSADELKQADAFRFEKDSRRFILRRSFVRQTLSQYLGIDAAEVPISYSPKGKPEILEGAGHKIKFSVSSSADLVVIALTRKCDVGIDIESISTEMSIRDIAGRYFPDDEINEINAADGNARSILFFSYWTQREAYVKALGTNLVDELPKRLHGTHQTESEWLVPFFGEGDEEWKCSSFQPEAGYVASVITRPEIRKISFFV